MDTAWAKEELEKIIKHNEPYLIEHLKIGGKDLVKLGLAGEKIGETLEFLQREVIKNPALNTKENLKKLITK